MKRILLSIALAASTCTLAAPSRAWDAGGHMIAARIAFDRLSPATKAKAEALVPLVPDFREARNGQKPRVYDFVSMAAWMDDIKSSKKREAYSSWHYIDIECGHAPEEVSEQNALDALDLARIILRSDAAPKVKAEWLAIAVHVIGDLHQPLHASGRDRGGNDFWIREAPGIGPSVTKSGQPVDRKKPEVGENAPYFQKLHALWDSGYRVDSVAGKKVDLFDIGYSERPDMARVALASAEIGTKYLPERPNITPDARVWALESSRISCDWVFNTPSGGIVSADYIGRVHDTSCTRLALAGARMSRWLEENLR